MQDLLEFSLFFMWSCVIVLILMSLAAEENI